MKNSVIKRVWKKNKPLFIIIIAFIIGAIVLARLSAKMDNIADNYGDYHRDYGKAPYYKSYSFSDSFSEAEIFTPSDCPTEIAEFTHNLCNEKGIDTNLVLALMYCESTYDKNAVNGNCYGLMQINSINDSYAEAIGCPDYKTDWKQNITVGVELLSNLEPKYSATESLIMAYNQGEAGADELLGEGFGSTEFTKKVYEKYQQYNAERNSYGFS